MHAPAPIEARIGRHQAGILAFLRRRCPGHAEELAQEVWLRVARADPDCPTDAAFRAYAFATARRLLIDHHRRRAARVRLVPLDGATGPIRTSPDRPDHHAHAAEVLAVVEATLDGMKPELAQVFRWRTTEDAPFKELARRQDCSINTALGRMHQATKTIRAALTEAGLLDGDTP